MVCTVRKRIKRCTDNHLRSRDPDLCASWLKRRSCKARCTYNEFGYRDVP